MVGTDAPPRLASVLRLWPAGLALALLLGAVYRLAWPGLIEWKHDEQWTYAQVQTALQGGSLPRHGMPSSAGTLNPGLSVWSFIVLGEVLAVDSPPDLARATQLGGLLALGLMVVFACRCVPRAERESWLWAAALCAVNPLTVVYQRKIWPPCLFPTMTLFLLLGWWHRERRGGAFLWGLMGGLLGQVQMAGFLYAAGFFLWGGFFDRQRIAWRGWLAGSLLAAVPLLPWMHYVGTTPGGGSTRDLRLIRIVSNRFWLHWVSEPLGQGQKFLLGAHYQEFLAAPWVNGRPTHAVAVCLAVQAALGAVVLGRAACRFWTVKSQWRERLIGRHSPTAFTLAAALLGYGGILTFCCLPFFRQYMLVTFPLPMVWLARQAVTDDNPTWAGRGRLALFLLCVLQAALTAYLLYFLRVHPTGLIEFGVPWDVQTAQAPSVSSLPLR